MICYKDLGIDVQRGSVYMRLGTDIEIRACILLVLLMPSLSLMAGGRDGHAHKTCLPIKSGLAIKIEVAKYDPICQDDPYSTHLKYVRSSLNGFGS